MCEDGFAGDDAPYAVCPSIDDNPEMPNTMDLKGSSSDEVHIKRFQVSVDADDTSWLSGDLEIDPIIENPFDTSTALAVAQHTPAEPILCGNHFHGVWVRPEEHKKFELCWETNSERVSTLTCTTVTRKKPRVRITH